MTDKEKLIKIKKLADAMYYAAQYLTTDASRLHKAMDEYHNFTIHECKEEPIPWLTPDQARRAVEIARKETLQEVKEKLLIMLNTSIDNKHFFEQLDDYIEELENKLRKMSKDKACISAVKEVCQRCPLYKENCGMLDFPDQCITSGRYIDGYRQAEKDLELTWEDIKEIYFLFRTVLNEWYGHEFSDEGICREVLKRFKERNP